MTVALAPVGARRRALAYLELTKPRISMLVMVTAVPALLLAAGGFPDPLLFWGTLVGTVLAAGSAASFNHYVDRDIDTAALHSALASVFGAGPASIMRKRPERCRSARMISSTGFAGSRLRA